MKRTELVEALATSSALSRARTSELLSALEYAVTQALVSGDVVKISGFGTFRVLHRDPRPGTNPRSGRDMTIPARRVISFRATDAFKSRIHEKRTAHRG